MALCTTCFHKAWSKTLRIWKKISTQDSIFQPIHNSYCLPWGTCLKLCACLLLWWISAPGKQVQLIPNSINLRTRLIPAFVCLWNSLILAQESRRVNDIVSYYKHIENNFSLMQNMSRFIFLKELNCFFIQSFQSSRETEKTSHVCNVSDIMVWRIFKENLWKAQIQVSAPSFPSHLDPSGLWDVRSWGLYTLSKWIPV